MRAQVGDLQVLIDEGAQFGTVYADPPWQYGNQATRAATDNHYATMTLESIAALPVARLAADNAHLHLWTTNAFLRPAFDIIEAWGFTYKSCFVWSKPELGIGGGAPLLLARLSALRVPDMMVMRDGVARWVEVKAKTTPIEFRKVAQWRHGIDLRPWDDYVEAETRSGIPGGLVIVQFKCGPYAPYAPRLLTAPFARLRQAVEQRNPEPHGNFKYGAVYWMVDTFDDRGAIDLRCPLADVTIKPRVEHPWQRPGRDGQAPRWIPKEERPRDPQLGFSFGKKGPA